MPAKLRPEIVDEIRKLFEQGMCSREIAPLVGKSQKAVQKIAKTYNLPRLPQGGPTGHRNGFWGNGRTLDKHGYVLVKADDHPMANSGGYVREHRLVMEKFLGRYLSASEVVHHINGEKNDNRLENLHLYENNGRHLAHDLSGRCPNWSEDGKRRIQESLLRRKGQRRTSILNGSEIDAQE